MSHSRVATSALLIVAFALLFAQTGGHAAPGDALPYARGFSGTVNYVVGSVDLSEQANPIDANGFSTGTLSITGVPADADIVAAYLYWETITLDAHPEQAAGVKFRGHEILLNDVMAVKKSSQLLSGSTASCWSSGVPLLMTLFRADVLPMLPVRVDKNNRPTGKRIVNDSDLTAHNLPAHSVYLPARAGNSLPESAGASLVIVYNHQSEPFRKVVFYDGIFIQPNLTTPMTQTLRGFYRSHKSSTPWDAKITHILASGQPNGNERVFFNDSDSANGTKISPTDPVMGGTASQRGWNALTYDVTQYMNPGANSAGGYGETATTVVDHAPGGGYDCLTWGSVIFSTPMEDNDPNGDPGVTNGPRGDGIPDGLEDAVGGLKDPDDTPLPNLKAMGTLSNPVGSDHRDLFVEINGMWTSGATYGHNNLGPDDPLPNAWVSNSNHVMPAPAHTHFPTPEDLKRVGDGYAAHGIRPHFDVGNIDAYHGRPTIVHADWIDDYSSDQADQYLVPSFDTSNPPQVLARGGEVIEERACDAVLHTAGGDVSNPSCHFPSFPGTVGWKLGLQVYRDAPVADDGTELDLTAPGAAQAWQDGTRRRRFDRARFGLFHYVLYAHARGTPKSQPCLSFGDPAPYDANNGTACSVDANHGPNPDFDENAYHVPTSASGIADLPGGNVLVTLGFWDEFVGKPFIRASTTFHELGHNLNLWHGGLPAVWGDNKPVTPLQATSTYIEPNCKPNYQSSMSYLFQVHGLFDSFDAIQLDYASRNYANTPLASLDETTSRNDVLLSSLVPAAPYRFAWYAPASSPLAQSLGAPPATRYCSGRTFSANPSMARVYTTALATAIDWNGDLVTSFGAAQDINLDGDSTAALMGFDDWSSIRLNQIAAGRKVVKFQAELLNGTGYGDTIDFGSGDTIDFGSGDTIDFGSGDTIDFGSGDTIDFGSGDLIDFGSGVLYDKVSGDTIDFGSGDVVDFGSGDTIDFGSGDTIDFGSGDTIDFGSGSERQEVDYDGARGLGRGVPSALTVCALGTLSCNITPPVTSSSKLYHHSLLRWTAVPVGKVTEYRIQRKKAGAADSTYTQIGTSTTNSFIDPDNLSDTGSFTYRVRARFDDVKAGELSGWSQPVTRGPVK